jgi:DNA-binding transcriptional regulator YdaS (Cro superfamily)
MDDMNDSPMAALDEAIAKFETLTVFADRVGVAQSTVSMWKARRRIPAENCPAIERETGVRCERLRPDVPWEVLREQADQAPAN